MSEDLTDPEKSLINRYGNFYAELLSGRRTPKTEKQKHFIDVCLGKAPPETDHEAAYLKYLKMLEDERRKAPQSGPADQSPPAPSLEDGIGQRAYPRSMDKTLDDAESWARRNGFKL
jgi:uncharacterized protein YifE (UPF0438 family)